MSRRDAGGGDAAREKVVDQTKLLDESGVPKLLRLLGEEIFKRVHLCKRGKKGGSQLNDCEVLRQLVGMPRRRKL